MFSPPFNWCDRRCERCRLSPGCAIRALAEEEVSDGPQPLTNEVLQQIEREEREVADDPAPRPVISARAKRVMEALEAGEMQSLDHFIVAAKLARLADQLDEPEADAIYEFDTVPNLLLLERLVEALPPATATALRDELAPLFAGIDVGLRRAMDVMVEAGVAPSPFCVDGAGQAGVERSA